MTFHGDWDLDCSIMYCFLEGVEFYNGNESRKMNNKRGVPNGRMLYGNTWKMFLMYDKITGEKIYRPPLPDNPSMGATKVKLLNPILEEVFSEFQELYFPGFEYNSVQLTKNFQIKRHIDSLNIGESVLCAFGNYTGGETVVEKEDGEWVIDCRKKPYKFNGSKYYHWVKPFEGTRYSLVFYKKK